MVDPVTWVAAVRIRERAGLPPMGRPWWWTPEWQREVDALLAG